jgi:mono/diheme cytochrome c family protein
LTRVPLSRNELCLARPAIWMLTGVLLSIAAMSVRAAHQTGAVISDGMQSTMGGVYTAPQAIRGEETYMGVCVACHPAGTYKTAAFKAACKGRPLSDLYDEVREKMPKNDPASLTPAEGAQVVAYLLKINGVPAGEIELPGDREALKKIRIEMPPAADRDN